MRRTRSREPGAKQMVCAARRAVVRIGVKSPFAVAAPSLRTAHECERTAPEDPPITYTLVTNASGNRACPRLPTVLRRPLQHGIRSLGRIVSRHV
jgi:hypothetical protein